MNIQYKAAHASYSYSKYDNLTIEHLFMRRLSSAYISTIFFIKIWGDSALLTCEVVWLKFSPRCKQHPNPREREPIGARIQWWRMLYLKGTTIVQYTPEPRNLLPYQLSLSQRGCPMPPLLIMHAPINSRGRRLVLRLEPNLCWRMISTYWVCIHWISCGSGTVDSQYSNSHCSSCIMSTCSLVVSLVCQS